MDKLKELRREIDQIDEEITRLLDTRFTLTKDIGHHKRMAGIEILDSGRESIVLNRIDALLENSPNKKNAIEIYKLIMALSKKDQSHL